MKADRIAGLSAVVVGVLVALASTNIQVVQSNDTLSARFFPYMLSAILVLGGAALLTFPGHTSLGDVAQRMFSQAALLFGAAFFVYALAFPYVDYRLSTWLFMFAVMWLLGSRHIVELLIVSTVVSLVTFYLFRYGFTVLLPTWI